MKNPILIIGILFMVIFLFDLKKRGIFFNRENIKANSCRAARIMLDKRIPSSWETKCEDNNLAILISLEQNIDEKQLKRYIYRELANNLIFIAKNSNLDSLEHVPWIRLKMQSAQFELNANTEGKHIVKLATLKDHKFISEHLKTTVTVQDIIK